MKVIVARLATRCRCDGGSRPMRGGCLHLVPSLRRASRRGMFAAIEKQEHGRSVSGRV